MLVLLQHPLFYALVGLLVGGLLGWWLRAVLRENALREEYLLRDQERNHLAATNTQLRAGFELKDADIKRLTLELGQLQERVGFYDNEKTMQESAVQSAAKQMQVKQAELEEQAAKITGFEEQILGLRSRNAQLTGDLGQLRETINAYQSMEQDWVALQQNSAGLEEAIAQIEHERNLVQRELDIAYIEIENLQYELMHKTMHTANGASNGGHSRMVIAPQPEIATREAKDDLKIINGIGPHTEAKLNELGIFTFGQLAGLDDAAIEKINKSIGLFAGKIKKDDWVGQAAHLLKVSMPEGMTA